MLKSLYIENFKVLKKVDVNLSNLTILSGLNGMGKSSFIQVLLLLRGSYLKRTLFSEGLILKNEHINLGLGKDVLNEDTDDEWIRFILDWEDETSLDLSFDYESRSNLQPRKSSSLETSSNLDSKSLFSKHFQYLSAERISPRNGLYETSDYDITQKKSLGKNGQFTAHYLAKYQKEKIEEALLHPSEEINSLIAQVDAWMSEISPGIKITAEIIEEINQASLHYRFETEVGYTKEFSPINVGFGLTYVLPVVTAILSAKPFDLLIIENPEAHLHPAGQAAIGRLMSIAAQNNVQLIIESHSDHLLNGIRVSVKNSLIDSKNVAIHYFTRPEDEKEHVIEIIEPYLDKFGRLDKWPKGFFDEWDKQLDELLK